MGGHSRASEIISYSFLVALANDTTIDADELRFIEKLALEDKSIDDDERAASAGSFSRVDAQAFEQSVQCEIADFRRRYDI